MNPTHKRSYRFGPALTAIGAAAAITLLGTQMTAQGQAQPDAALTVGTYDQQSVFESYPGAQELVDFYRTAEQMLREAQQQGDQMKLQEVQQQIETRRQQTIQGFNAAVGSAIPDVAQDADVDVVAVEVLYTAENVATTDLTDQLADALSNGG